MKFFIQILLDLCIYILKKSINNLNKIKNLINFKDRLKIIAINNNQRGRFLEFTLLNVNNLQNKQAFHALFNSLMNNKLFLEFGDKKIIIVSGRSADNDITLACHHNVLINNSTSFEEYWDKINENVNKMYDDTRENEDSYRLINNVRIFYAKVWNMDKMVNKNIQITKSAITLSDKNKILCIDHLNKEFVFSSISECSRILQIERSLIKKCLLSGETACGYKFKFHPYKNFDRKEG